MISSGYFGIDKAKLRSLGKAQAIQFITEMRDNGGRIGHHEAADWLQWIEKNL